MKKKIKQMINNIEKEQRTKELNKDTNKPTTFDLLVETFNCVALTLSNT